MRTSISVLLLFAAVSLVHVPCARAQFEIDPAKSPSVVVDDSTAPPVWTFTWWAKRDRHYFVQWSTNLLDDWVTLPNYNPTGHGNFISVHFTHEAEEPEPPLYEFEQSDKYFFRVIEFDPNGAGATDSDGDGLPDIWELYYFGDLSRDGTGDYDGDGISDYFEFLGGGDPTRNPKDYAGDRSNFTYDSLGQIQTVGAPRNMNFTFDKEGNLRSVQ